mgnify:CR=1 FL=1
MTHPWSNHYPPGVAATLAPLAHSSLPEMLVAVAKEFDSALAFTACLPNGMNGSLTFAQVDRHSDAFAAYLREDLRLEPGDRVAVQMPNGLAYPVVAFGILKAGCVLVNTNPLYTASEIAQQYTDADVSAVVVVDMFADRLAPTLASLGDPPVVLVQLTEFFPRYVANTVRLVQRVWSRTLPRITFPATRLVDALRSGAMRAPADPSTYWRDIGPDTLAALQYTGGTTGVSKGAMLTHGNLLSNAEQMLQLIGGAIRPGLECVLTALPLYHIFAFTVNLLGFVEARTTCWCLHPDPRRTSSEPWKSTRSPGSPGSTPCSMRCAKSDGSSTTRQLTCAPR